MQSRVPDESWIEKRDLLVLLIELSGVEWVLVVGQLRLLRTIKIVLDPFALRNEGLLPTLLLGREGEKRLLLRVPEALHGIREHGLVWLVCVFTTF